VRKGDVNASPFQQKDELCFLVKRFLLLSFSPFQREQDLRIGLLKLVTSKKYIVNN
jgi:hypothetical protein